MRTITNQVPHNLTVHLRNEPLRLRPIHQQDPDLEGILDLRRHRGAADDVDVGPVVHSVSKDEAESCAQTE
jgi:hypothetical protein